MFLRFFKALTSNLFASEEEEEPPTKWLKYKREDELSSDASTSVTVTGIVTLIDGSFGLIDSKLYFSYPIPGVAVTMGDEVSYVRYRASPSAPWKVKKIMAVVQDCWVEKEEEEEGELERAQKKMPGKVEAAGGKRTKIAIENFRGELDLSRFDLPKMLPGDWLMLDLTGTFDPVTHHLKKILKVHGAAPNRLIHCTGKVTLLNKGFGLVDNKFLFLRASCATYTPKIRDMVQVVAIESTQGKHAWRVIDMQQASEERKEQLLTANAILPGSAENMGIEIRPNMIEFGTIQAARPGVRHVEITNTTNKPEVLMGVTFSSGKHYEVQDPETVSHLLVPAHQSVIVKLCCKPNGLGDAPDIATFNFGCFTMLRRVTAVVVASSAVAALRLAAKQMNVSRELKIVKGEFSVQTSYLIPRRLPQYPVPEMLYKIYETYDWRDDRSFMEAFPALGKRLTPETYVGKLDGLLYLEEAENMLHLREYDVIGTTFRRKGDFLSMAVTGLSEARPSIMVGDCVIASPPHDKTADRFQGCIHEVRSTEIYLRFAPSFHEQYDGESYDVRFEVSRSGYRRLHQGVDLFLRHLPQEILFPTHVMVSQPRVTFIEMGNEPLHPPRKFPKVHEVPHESVAYGTEDMTKPDAMLDTSSGNDSQQQSQKPKPATTTDVGPSLARRKPNLHIRDYSELMRPLKSNWRVGLTHPVSLRWVNRNLNEQQKNAVRRILKGEARPLPYIIYGPPGTGKTVTLIEAALQAYRLINFSRILVVTPSNSSADLIVTRLHRTGILKIGDMVRLNSFRRGTDTLTSEIKPYCMDSDSLDQVVHHRLVVTTCNASGTIYTLGLTYGHFTHVFIDEAGYANEPEALVPIGLLSNSPGEAQIVLAGDPKQLGPVLTSRLAKRNGLERSLLERLTENQLYRRDDVKFAHDGNYDPLLVTKLVINYRSDPLLLKFPSRMFYHNELIAQADLSKWADLRKLDIFPTKSVALVFCGVKGENEQDKDSPSWYNKAEVFEVWQHLQVLYDQGGLKPEHVGIITPYRKQVEKIRQFLDIVGTPRPKIGSVEEFQGQERVAIILSTVRSMQELWKMDQIFNLGFVASPKRMNVALTRAEACLVVIGNPHVLALDREWRAFLSYAYELGAFKGCEMPNIVISGQDEDGEDGLETTSF